MTGKHRRVRLTLVIYLGRTAAHTECTSSAAASLERHAVKGLQWDSVSSEKVARDAPNMANIQSLYVCHLGQHDLLIITEDVFNVYRFANESNN